MKLFYDHLVMIDEVFAEIDLLEISNDEKKEMRQLIDEMAHHAVLTHVLDILPRDHHEDFLTRFHAAPHDLSIIKYLEKKIEKDIHAEIATVGNRLKKEIRKEFKKHTKK